jgi:hypothetical protein
MIISKDQEKSHSEIVGVRTPTYLLRGHTPTHNNTLIIKSSDGSSRKAQRI